MRLIPLTRELATALARGDFSAFPARSVRNAEVHLREVAKAYGELYDRISPSPPWIGYLAEDETGQIIGSCGYKGDCRDGIVEIAYFAFPEHQNRGFGREMARLLTDLALRQRAVNIVCAHTLREENASARILRRLGFSWLGTVDDPEDGLIWRWELSRP